MDVQCATCGELWETYHLQHDEIYEVARSSMEAETWLDLPGRQRLMEPYRTLFRQAGWEFGLTVLTVLHCPCCPATATLDREAVWIRAALEEVLADDEDALAAELSDLGL